ncbi:MAG: DUF1573 domain-containing protein [Chitinophagales bacterium]|nr:DUF1573 domain-containing protein [Chitinophagales bacterium]MCZ2392744.1 DUF1573 domain-containing protein [Chitinophagales bacterium]
MKKLMLSLTLLFSVFVVANAQTEAGPAIKWEATTIDYGTVQQGADGSREFVLTNTGNAPLIISKATGSCGCTVPVWPKEPILPGQKSAIKVHYDTNRIGSFTKTVTVVSNATNNTDILQIKGNVLAKEGAEGQ